MLGIAYVFVVVQSLVVAPELRISDAGYSALCMVTAIEGY